MTDYDLIIIGAGAGGSTVARALADTGKRILIVERGDYLPQEDKNWDPDHIFLNRGYKVEEEWLDKDGEHFKPEILYRVGGNTKVYGAVLQRMRERDFDELSYPDGVSPGWPITYADMEPYYMLAEHWYCIHGQRGEDPTEPPASGPYPFEPMPHEPRMQEVADALAEQGLRPFHATLALNRDVDQPANRPCIRCMTCDPYPCKLHAKQDAETAGILPALHHDNVYLWTRTEVLQLEADNERVQRIVVRKDVEEFALTAKTVVLSAGAINSAALLLKSKSEHYPDGLANRSGLVGRNLMKHNHSGITAVAEKPNPTVFQKTIGFHDYYFGSPEHAYPLGTIQTTGKAPWQRLKITATGDLPETTLKHMAEHSVDWWVTTEDLPDPANRVTVDAQGRNQVHFTPNNRRPHRELMRIWIDHLRQADFYLFMTKTMELPTLWHQAGTCLMGTDPTTSVLNTDCRTHDLDNLYVVDASFFPSMGAVNPTLTIIANALRVADRLREVI